MWMNETNLFFLITATQKVYICKTAYMKWMKFTTAQGEVKNWKLSSSSSWAIHQSETIAIVLCIDWLMI